MSMSIPLKFNGTYGDTIVRHHLTKELEVERTYTNETSRGPITKKVMEIFPYLEIVYGQCEILLTTKNAVLIDYLVQGELFDYADAGHGKLVQAMLGDVPTPKKEIIIEADVIEAEIVDEETNLSPEALRKLGFTDLKKLAKSQGISAKPSMKKEDLIGAIIGEEEVEESVEE